MKKVLKTSKTSRYVEKHKDGESYVEKHRDGDKHEGGKSVEGFWELSLETRIEKRQVRKMKGKKIA